MLHEGLADVQGFAAGWLPRWGSDWQPTAASEVHFASMTSMEPSVVLRTAALIVVAAGLLAGADFPTPAQQLASFAPFVHSQIEGEGAVAWLDAHRVLLLNQVRMLGSDRVAGGGGYACATPISADGYLLTAAHAAIEPLIGIRAGHGPERVSPLRVVWRGPPGCDLALLKAGWDDCACIAWSGNQAMRVSAPVLAAGTSMAEDATHQWFQPEHSAGVLQELEHITSPAGAPVPFEVISARIPAHPGDSGGPLVSRDGRLLGVMVAHVLNADGTSTGDSLAVRPDPAAILSLIAHDRAAHARHAPAAALATVVGR